ncbi:MAG: esterase/lipase family protein [Haloarculaceae archaeon]
MAAEQWAGASPGFLRRLAANHRELRRCRRQDGCRVDCAHDRTDDRRLPWSTDDYGGWGGHAYHGTDPGSARTPVVFVHGNQRDACDWDAHAEFFRNRAYGGDDLWAITFGPASPGHDAMADQLEDFVARVREHAGVDEVAIVAHSLGVTGVRYWLHREERYDWVETFVGLAGANHGTVLNSLAAMAGVTHGPYKVSPFLRSDYDRLTEHPLADLNAEETPGDVEYYTLRGRRDPLFWNSLDSPALDGATNLVLDTDHDGVRASLTAVEEIYTALTDEPPYSLDTIRASRDAALGDD